MFAISHLLHKNMIMEWPLAIAAIPSGWTLCDGTLGTPDLTDKFIVGAGDTYAVGAGGGGTIHRHTFSGDGHSHIIQDGSYIASGVGYNYETETDPVTGLTGYANHLPPFYALVFIMKL